MNLDLKNINVSPKLMRASQCKICKGTGLQKKSSFNCRNCNGRGYYFWYSEWKKL